MLAATLTGTLNAIGAMYGPIMPVMNPSGTKARMMVMVDISKGVRISAMASTTRSYVLFPLRLR